MTPIYIIHPFKGKGGEYEVNKERVSRICRLITAECPHVLPISPIHAFGFTDDTVPEERVKALELCKQLLRTVAQAEGEAWVYGEWQTSSGCLGEVELARQLGIPLRFHS